MLAESMMMYTVDANRQLAEIGCLSKLHESQIEAVECMALQGQVKQLEFQAVLVRWTNMHAFLTQLYSFKTLFNPMVLNQGVGSPTVQGKLQS